MLISPYKTRATRTNKRSQKVCGGCKQRYTPAPEDPPFKNWCNYECGVKIARERQTKALKKKRQEEDRAWAARKAALGPSRKEINRKIASAEKAVRLYCRIRDQEECCISCYAERGEVESRPDNGGGHWDGGHFMPKGAYPELRFNTWNIHKQCKDCNGGEGKYRHKAEKVRQGYEIGLSAKIGPERVAWLKGPHPILQPDIDYCNRIIRIFNKRAKHIKKLRGYT